MSSRPAPPRELYSAQVWKERLRDAIDDNRKVVFVVGAGLSWDRQGGVWGVADVVKHAGTLCSGVTAAGTADGYQSVLKALKGKKGASAVEQVIRRAVVAAAGDGPFARPALQEIASGTAVAECRALQENASAWYLPKGVLALAELLAGLVKARKNASAGYPCVLSTNFDGLVEVALRRQEIPCESVVVAENRFPRGLDQKMAVVHLHGFWCEQPTLHSPGALQVERDVLAQALRSLLEGAQVFVLGYGGWNDIFLATMADIFQHQAANQLPELVWAFYESEAEVRANEANRESAVGHVLDAFSNAAALAYTSFYCGVDAHRDLPEVADELRKSRTRPVVGHDEQRSKRMGEPSSHETLGGGRYVLQEKLGHGGFATVWKARDTRVEDPSAPDGWVAIKVMHAHLTGDSVAVDRFFRGARTMAELGHPGIVRILEPRGEDGGHRYVVMELMSGGTFRAAVREKRMGQAEALRMILGVAKTLAVAHQRGFVHRDVKPANVLLGADGQAKLSDFDLVGGGDTTGGTNTAAALGSFAYSAPECLSHPRDAGPAADVFSLGMMLVFALQGEDPHPYTMDREHRSLPCGEAMRRVICRATSIRPEDRQADASKLVAELEAVVGSRDVSENSAVAIPAWATRGGQDAFGTFAELELASGVVTRMRWIPPGEFLMGSPEDEIGRSGDEGPQHKVVLTKGFWLADAPCTQAEWQAVMASSPSHFEGANLPVEQVSWDDCQVFCRALRIRIPSMAARLPTESEWEYACRAGTTSAFNDGSPCTEPWGKDAALAKLGWFDKTSGGRSHEVRGLEPNRWGLYDMHGNVWEWCDDWYGGYSVQEQTDPASANAGLGRVYRGGAWARWTSYCRSAYRSGWQPDRRSRNLGFRLASGQ